MIVVSLGILLGTAAFYVYQVSAALGVVASEDFSPDSALAAILATPESPSPTILDLTIVEPLYDVNGDPLELIADTYGAKFSPQELYPTVFGEPIPDEVFEAYLLVGSDASGHLADTIILALQPNVGGAPIVVSLPRDLWVWNICKNRFSRLNEGLSGCSGMASGSELMAIMVEDYTGIPVDHLARINFDGFANLVDAMGGITVCVDYPSRDAKSKLDITEPGCQVVDGDTALAWVRSRGMEQFIDEDWVVVSGSDFGRQTRQQDVLFQLAGKAASFSSPTSLSSKLSAVASSVRLDSSWSFGQAVSVGWKYRGVTKSSVDRFSISVRDYRTSGGAQVLLPTKTFRDQLSVVYFVG